MFELYYYIKCKHRVNCIDVVFVTVFFNFLFTTVIITTGLYFFTFNFFSLLVKKVSLQKNLIFGGGQVGWGGVRVWQMLKTLLKTRPLVQTRPNTDLTRWGVHCCSGASRRCSGGVWCSGSCSAHLQAGCPGCTGLLWVWWDIVVLQQTEKPGERVDQRVEQQRCLCWAADLFLSTR